MSQKVLRLEHHLNASKTKTLTMGLDVNTLTPIITLSGSKGHEVHLTAAEVLRLLDDFGERSREHLSQYPEVSPPLPVTEHLSDDHNIVFGWFNIQPVIIITKRPKDEPQDQLLEELAPFIKRKKPLQVQEVILAKPTWENLVNATTVLRMMVRRYHAYSERAPIWLRDFARCIVKAGGPFYRDSRPMPLEEQVVVERSYNDNLFQTSWQDVVQNEYANKNTDPMEIQFLTEMCLEHTDRVKDELLKVWSPPEIYPRASYYH